MRASTLSLALLSCIDDLSSSIAPCIEQVITVVITTAPQRVRQALAYAAWLAHYGREIDLETVLNAWKQS